MTDISDERERIRDILVAYISEHEKPANWTAHRYLPRQLNNAGLPAFITLPQSSTRERINTNARKVTRIYRVRLYIAPISDGVSNQVEADAETLVDEIADYLNEYLRLGMDGVDAGLNGVLNAEIVSDGGLFAAQYPENDPNAAYYLATEWFWRVTSTRRLTNAR